jgi:hypothetical protein
MKCIKVNTERASLLIDVAFMIVFNFGSLNSFELSHILMHTRTPVFLVMNLIALILKALISSHDI